MRLRLTRPAALLVSLATTGGAAAIVATRALAGGQHAAFTVPVAAAAPEPPAAPVPAVTASPLPGPAPAVGTPAAVTGRDAEKRAAVLAFVGAAGVPSVDALRWRGGTWARYEADFVEWGDPQWKAAAAAGRVPDHHYDRAAIYYVWWARTGNPAYRTRAAAMGADLRDWYANTLAGNQLPPIYKLAPTGLALHALVEGDAKSRATALLLGAWTSGARTWAFGALSLPVEKAGDMDPRNRARALQATLDAHLLTRATPGPAASEDYRARLRIMLPLILATQARSGSFPVAPDPVGGRVRGGGEKPFMSGVLAHQLQRYYEQFEADPRIPAAVRRWCDYVWPRLVVLRDPAKPNDPVVQVRYRELPGMGADGTLEPTAPTAELNMLMVSAFAFAAAHASAADAPELWRRADALWAGGMAPMHLGEKLWNQRYAQSTRYLALREAAGRR
jgi:hypothetical protein